VLSTILFTVLFEFAGLVWLNLKRVQCQFDDVYGKIDVLQKSIKVTVVSLREFGPVLTDYFSPSNQPLLPTLPLNVQMTWPF